MTIQSSADPMFPDFKGDAAGPRKRTQLKEAIRDFLAVAASRSSQGEFCPRCGRAMQHLNATFSFYGGDRQQWNIPLPVCPCSGGDSAEQASQKTFS